VKRGIFGIVECIHVTVFALAYRYKSINYRNEWVSFKSDRLAKSRDYVKNAEWNKAAKVTPIEPSYLNRQGIANLPISHP